MNTLSLFRFVAGLVFLAGLVSGCQSGSGSSEAHRPASEGELLAQRHCGGCHLPVSPVLLDRETWLERVLPAMAPKLGMEVWQQHKYYQPAGAAISLADWTTLVSYFEQQAPEKLPASVAPTPLKTDWSLFTLRTPAEEKATVATTTLVAVDPAGRQIYSSNQTDAGLYRWNAALRPARLLTLPSPAVQAQFEAGPSGTRQAVLTCIGTMLAVDQPRGEVLSLNPDQLAKSPVVYGRQLPRPIQSVPGDFDRDGLTDRIVCGFGHNAGGLYWLRQRPDQSYEQRVIKATPGATQVITGDFNRDGWLDFMALFAHADEGIWLFTNNRKGGFTEKAVLRFPPIYGSTSFQLADFNGDGRTDILYTCGDNSDYSRILKPYHGVYLFTNQGNDRYRQTYFYPINGCTKAIAADFDQDGDLDLATIAFFADLKNKPTETFLYFEQQTPRTFQPHAVPVHAYGRWICLDVNDWNGDGDLDIVLGNYARGFLNEPGLTPTWNQHLPLIVLENRLR